MRILKPLPGTLPMPGHSLADAVGLWPMTSLGNKVFDLSGNYKHGILLGGDVTWVLGKFGYALNFPGTVGDYVVADGVPDVFDLTAPWTMNCWAKIDNFPGAIEVIIGLIDQDGAEHISLGYNNNIPGRFKIVTNGHTPPAGTILATNTWYMMTLVHTGSAQFSCYLNAIFDYSVDGTGTLLANMSELQIGAISNAVYNIYIDGQVDNAMIWPRALYVFEIEKLYRESFCMFPENIMPEFAIVA